MRESSMKYWKTLKPCAKKKMVGDREKRHWKKAIINKNPHGLQKPDVKRMSFFM